MQSGWVQLSNFRIAYYALRAGSNNHDIVFHHHWYDERNGKMNIGFLSGIDATLNDDCIREIMDRSEILNLADMANYSERFLHIAKARISTLKIYPMNVGQSFGLMNFRYVLEVFGNEVVNLFISLHSFRRAGANRHYFNTKYAILHLAVFSTSSKLTVVSLESFNFSCGELEKIQPLIDLLRERGVELNIL